MAVTTHITAFTMRTAPEVARAIADRVRAARLERGWTQAGTARRAGITLASYRRFESSGQITLERLLRVATVLDALPGFEALFEPPPARSLDELERRSARRRRGRRGDA